MSMLRLGPQPPQRPHPFFHPLNQINNVQLRQTKSNLLSMFQTSEGNLDFERITGTVQQISKLYGQVSPMFSKFTKNRI